MSGFMVEPYLQSTGLGKCSLFKEFSDRPCDFLEMSSRRARLGSIACLLLGTFLSHLNANFLSSNRFLISVVRC